MAGTGAQAIDKDRTIDPLEPRPANVLDLAGASALLLSLGDGPAQAEVAGVETVDGREVVRVAWAGNRDDGNGGGGLRGLLWVAPSLGFAVVRSEATQDPSQAGMAHGRRTWRKTAGDFVEVGGLWLPRKVEARFAEVNGNGTPAPSQEIVATLEDYRANPELPPETFHPQFKIEALDEQSGQFTTMPPDPVPGLVERLKRAVAESPFGPPGARQPADAPPATRPGTDVRSINRAADRTNPPAGASTPPGPVQPPTTSANRAAPDIVTNVDQAPTARPTPDVKAPDRGPAQSGSQSEPPRRRLDAGRRAREG